ncbi:MAG: type IV pilus twitching motility protein PilT [Elusimicrobiales bacterium]
MAVDIAVLLKTMVQYGASDLHIRNDSKAFLRIHGDIKGIDGSEMTSAEVEALALSLMNDKSKRIYEERMASDFSVDGGKVGRFRFNVFRQRGKPCIAVRHIPLKIPTFADLNLPAATLQKMALNERGLILVTGVTGSGKTSTLAAMIDHINESCDDHIITIEDPIEFVHRDKRSIVAQREIGSDATDFLDALRSAMRQDPDVILVGEMRDLETMRAAVTAAETGHLVFATVHTMNAVQTLTRIIDLFPSHQQTQIRMQLSDTLKGILSQRLLPRCGGGRVPAMEVMIVTPHIKKLIEDNNLSGITSAIQKGAYYGMQTFNQSMVALAKSGTVTTEDVLAAASNPDDVMLALRGIEQESEQHKAC